MTTYACCCTRHVSFPPVAREQSGSEKVFLSGNYPQQGSVKGQRGSPSGLYAVQCQRNFQGKENNKKKASADLCLFGLRNGKAVCFFMQRSYASVPQIPGALHKGVSDMLARLSQGQQPDVTGKCYKRQREKSLR